MNTCPFCSGDVTEDLIIYGGCCTHCFCEIPGEESPTDPGESKKAEMEAEHQDLKRRKQRVPFLIGVPVLVLLLGALVVQVLAKPEPVKTLNLDETTDYWGASDPFEIVVTSEPATTMDESKKTTSSGPSGAAFKQAAGQGGDISTSTDDLDELNAMAAKTKGGSTQILSTRKGGALNESTEVGELAQMTTSSSSGGPSLFGDVGMKVEQNIEQGVTLQDDDAIILMVKRVLAAEMPKLQSCYERRLKLVNNLKGAWTIELTVLKDGGVASAAAKGNNISDPELEKCIADQMASWSFQPIRIDMPIQKSVYFRPG